MNNRTADPFFEARACEKKDVDENYDLLAQRALCDTPFLDALLPRFRYPTTHAVERSDRTIGRRRLFSLFEG